MKERMKLQKKKNKVEDQHQNEVRIILKIKKNN